MADDSEGIIQAPAAAFGTGVETDEPRKIARYVEEIELYEKETQKWDRQSKRIIRRYKDDRGGDGTVESQERRYNILWSNTQNLKPILWARNPKSDIQRRYKDSDPVGRVTSDVLERSVSYFTETDHFYNTNAQCVTDYILSGRGTLWVRYVPHFKDAPVEVTDDVGPGDENQPQAVAPQVIDYEEVVPDYVHRADFGHNICRTWDEVWLVWRIVYLTKKELKARFVNLTDAEINAIPLDYKKQDITGKVIDDGVSKAVIYEAWDKIKREALWFHKTIPDALDDRPDPLRLDNFFPTPKPLFANLANDSLIPVPDYVEYQDQASELDLLTARIAMMTRCLKVVGVYDASSEGLNRMFNEGTENELIPVQQWALLAEKGGMAGAMSLLDIKSIAETLLSAYQARDKVLQDLDNITGMSDIVRGATDPNETATAQALKASYSNQRISDRQRDVQMFARQTIRIMVDIICNHFQIETIKEISGVRLLTQQEKQLYTPKPPQPAQPGMAPQPPPPPPPLPPNVTPDQMEDMLANPTWEEVGALIKDNAMRCFRIDIETNSTIKADEEAEKQSRVEYVKAVGEYIASALPAGQQHPELVPFLLEGLKFLSRGFPVGKDMEGILNVAIAKLEKAANNPQQKPTPEMMKVQGDQQIAQTKLQGDMQLAHQKQQGDIQLQQAQMQADAQTEQARVHANIQIEQAKAQAQAAVQTRQNELEAGRRQAELAQEMQLAQIKIAAEADLQLKKAHIAAAASIEVARINAKADDGKEAEAREASGE